MKNEDTTPLSSESYEELCSLEERVCQAITTAILNPDLTSPVLPEYRGEWLAATTIIGELRPLIETDLSGFMVLTESIIWKFVYLTYSTASERMHHAEIILTYVWMDIKHETFTSEAELIACRIIFHDKIDFLRRYRENVLQCLPDPHKFTIQDVKRCSDNMQPERRIYFLETVLEGVSHEYRGVLSHLQVTAIEQELSNRKTNLSREFFQTDTPTAIAIVEAPPPDRLLQRITDAGGAKVVEFLNDLDRDTATKKFIWPWTWKGWQTKQGLAFFVDYLFGRRCDGRAFLVHDERRFHNVGEYFVFIQGEQITAIDSIQSTGNQLSRRNCPEVIEGLFVVSETTTERQRND